MFLFFKKKKYQIQNNNIFENICFYLHHLRFLSVIDTESGRSSIIKNGSKNSVLFVHYIQVTYQKGFIQKSIATFCFKVLFLNPKLIIIPFELVFLSSNKRK